MGPLAALPRVRRDPAARDREGRGLGGNGRARCGHATHAGTAAARDAVRVALPTAKRRRHARLHAWQALQVQRLHASSAPALKEARTLYVPTARAAQPRTGRAGTCGSLLTLQHDCAFRYSEMTSCALFPLGRPEPKGLVLSAKVRAVRRVASRPAGSGGCHPSRVCVMRRVLIGGPLCLLHARASSRYCWPARWRRRARLSRKRRWQRG